MYSDYTDDALQQLLRCGDPPAFDEVYRRYWKMLAQYAYKLTGCKKEVSDIVQDVFVSLWRRRQEFTPSGALKPYLFKCVRNLSLRYLEKNIHQKKYFESLAAFAQQLQVSDVRVAEANDLEEKLNGAVARLPEKMRDVFMLSRYEHLSHREIARKLGIAETTVKKQVSNALKLLRSEVKELDVLMTFILLGICS